MLSKHKDRAQWMQKMPIPLMESAEYALSAMAGFVPKQFAAHARAGAARLLLWSRGGDGR
jgi:hypothetical protein